MNKNFIVTPFHIFHLIQILQDTLFNLHEQGETNEFYQPVHTYVMNPKSITMDELYGGVDKITQEWKDGLMGLTVRHCVQVEIDRLLFIGYVKLVSLMGIYGFLPHENMNL